VTAGLITTSDGWSYRLTPEDKLWAARMLLGEGGDGAAVLWSMAQRLALARGSSFTALIRNYSQPINPIWARSGTKCGPGGSGVGTDACDEGLLARRTVIAGTQPEDMPVKVALVERWAAGLEPNRVPRAVHFATEEVVAGCLANRDCTSIVGRLGNVFAATARSERWPSNYVRVGGAGEAPSSSWLGPVVGLGVALLAGALGAGAAWAWDQK